MGQQIIPQGQMNGMVPNDPFMQVLDKLAQALGGMAQTQQEILNRLQAAPQLPPPRSNAVKVIPFHSFVSKRDQYNWLYNYALHYNLDGTPKTQVITTQDVEQHQEMLNKFWAAYNCK